MIKYLQILFLLFVISAAAQEKKFIMHTVVFYNVENLFDTINDERINDEEFLPEGRQHWTGKKYRQKLANLAQVIADVGKKENTNPATIVGLAEIENRTVLEDLVRQPALADAGYGVIHFDSPDLRGMDVALLYAKERFRPTSYTSVPLIIKPALNEDDTAATEEDEEDKSSKRIFTRSQLLVTGLLEGEEIHFIVNHWPSRSGGEKRSSPYREAAAVLNKKIIDSLYSINPEAKVITMGDFNDGPYNNSIKKTLGVKGRKEDLKPYSLYNPMEAIALKGTGSLAYQDAWDLFDQMIVTEPLARKDYRSLRFWKANVFDKHYLKQPTGRYKGYPLRNWNGEVGYSDHFPVYLYLIKQVN